MSRVLLFHISDLHFGSTFEGTHVASSGLLTGLNGHGFSLAESLEAGLRQARIDISATEDDRIEYLVGGDLTRTGSRHDFHLVYSYLYSHLEWAHDRTGMAVRIGLDLDVSLVHCVPGNHDHWKGQAAVSPWSWPPAYNSTVHPDLLQETPWRHTIWSPNDEFAVELFGVDSNEGLNHKGTNVRARGKLSAGELYGIQNAQGNYQKLGLQQLFAAAQQDATNDQKPRIAAVACHHSLGSKHGITGAQPLIPSSVRDLLALCRGVHGPFRVPVVLTGHTHYYVPHPWPDPAGLQDIYELRCASTVQMDPQPGGQAFLVHEIGLDEHGAPTWQTWSHEWNGASFVRNTQPFNVP